MEIYIVLTDTGTLFTNMIKMYTKQSLNHASISFTKDLRTTYSFGRKNANNPFIGGFVKESMNGKLFKRAKCAIYSRTFSEFEYKQMKQFVQRVENQQQNYKYNLIGLFGILLNREITRDNAFFCSEFVANALNNGGISIKSKPAGLVKPNDLIECDGFRLVYKGELCTYLSKQRGETGAALAKNSGNNRRFAALNRIYGKLTKSIAS